MIRQSPDIGNLLARMTVREKIGQLTMMTGEWAVTGPKAVPASMDAIRAGDAGSFLNLWSPQAVREAQRVAVEESRLGLPLFIGYDVIHGHRTVFPIPLGETASFDRGLWQRTAAAAAGEAAEDGISLTFAPMLDVARDLRWGRICEGAGEDPYVASEVARAKISGFQGDSLHDADRIAACAKHLGAYGAVLAGRDYATADVSPRELEEVHLPAFQAAVAAGVAAVMPSFNDIAGIPSHCNRDLLEGWLRLRLGFDGLIISDYNAVAELVVHGVAADLTEAAALALRAGIDIDMMGEAYLHGLEPALQRGLISEREIDRSVRRVLELKAKLGLFADPCRGLDGDELAPVRHRPLAREAAGKSIVLLKNDNGLLPLPSRGGRVAVIGPLAESAADMLGSWSGAGRGEECVTFLAGLRAAFPDRGIVYAKGADILLATDGSVAEAVVAADSAEVVILCLGEERGMSGEACCRAEPDLPRAQARLAEAVIATGKPVILVLSSGRPIILPRAIVDGCGAILATWFLGSEAGSALGDVLSGARAPSGRLPVTWPVSAGQAPIYYARRRSGRPADYKLHYTSKYLDVPVEPLYPFGHGLSYTKFKLENLRLSSTVLAVPGEIEVAVDILNCGDCDGETVVFLFIQDAVASVTRPVLSAKGFIRAQVIAGSSLEARFTLTSDDLRFPGVDMRSRIENGAVRVMLGERAVESELLSATFTVTGGIDALGASDVVA